MSLDKIKAVNDYIFVIKDKEITERKGLKVPEHSVVKPNTGKILSVGSKVTDVNAVKDATAIFNKSAGGNIIELFDTEIIVLIQDKLLGIL